MGMTADRLRQLLAQVHTKLETTQTLDDEGRALVLNTMGELAGLLEKPKDEPKSDQDESLGERLEDAAKQFEADHPQLFTALQQIIDTLRGAGI